VEEKMGQYDKYFEKLERKGVSLEDANLEALEQEVIELLIKIDTVMEDYGISPDELSIEMRKQHLVLTGGKA